MKTEEKFADNYIITSFRICDLRTDTPPKFAELLSGLTKKMAFPPLVTTFRELRN
jgi:hypothetical protein